MLGSLFGEVYDLLEDPSAPQDTDPLAAMVGIGTAVEPPADPALARLLPDAHRDDPQAAAEFRRYTESGLRSRKRAGLAVARGTLEHDGLVRLDDEQAQAWLVALTDVRLVLAERMGVRTDEDHDRLVHLVGDLLDEEAGDLDPEVPAAGQRLAAMLGMYDFLAWLQETLVEALED
jgi:hypothetical protein